MAFTESFHCDVCGKAKNEGSEDWWLASIESMSPVADPVDQPLMQFTRWNTLVAHATETKHLCGASCMHTLLDRWMLAGDYRSSEPRSSGAPVSSAKASVALRRA